MVNLIDGHDDRHLGGLRVCKGFHRLRHDAVVRADDEDDDVGDVGAAGAHGAERGVARRVEEGDLLELFRMLGVRDVDGVGADVLGDASGLPGGDVRVADDVEQRGFAVIHVAHDRDHWGAGLPILLDVVGVEDDFFHGGGLDEAGAALAPLEPESETVLGADFAGDRLLDGLVDVGEDVERHQVGDQLEWLALHLVGEIADDDRRLHGDQRAIGRCREFWLGRAGRRCGSGCGSGCRPLGLRVLGRFLVFFIFAFAYRRSNRHVAQLDKAHFFTQIG